MDVDVWTVLVAALVTALATGLGAAPFIVARSASRRWLGIGRALAGGVMLGASVGLLREGVAYGAWRTAAGAIAGLVFIVAVRRALAHRDELTVGALRGADALKAFVIVAVMTAHSFTEGVGIGVSYGGGEALGAFITAAMAVHNIPEGLAISLVLVPRGVRVHAAAGWAVFSSLPQPLMAVPAFVFVETFEPILPAGLGFAAGAMIWMVVAELVPEARLNAPGKTIWPAALVAAAAMAVIQEVAL
jgi:ZIP family zinc transporter